MQDADNHTDYSTQLHMVEAGGRRFHIESGRCPNPPSEHPLEFKITQMETQALGHYDIEYGGYINLFDEENHLVGGLQLQRRWQMCKLFAFWLEEQYRGMGLGKYLLAEAESLAQLMGANHLMLETSTLHHYAFYLAQGFEVISALDNVIPGHDFYIMRKSIFTSASQEESRLASV
ncbi:GNAT family N-acetyltransferase [Alteromonas sp. a30]|uniref:GNAT family N-acetyltransferase n=1 Tax=Alteromonas sp. a30 TaxID=2730917 RepID=UPI0022817190|nr:GNAT family N-acetyltransferase [Alteromonas sp. a30]MCY7293852.1 GNAT family N-acetyltransferase [Alteromonas sp. a30]